MLRFSILPRALVALNAIRSTETNRPVLNGVHLAPDGTMTATDGHCLLTWRNAATYPDLPAATEGEAIAMLDADKDGYVLEITPALLKLAKLKKCDRLALEITDDVARWTMVTATGYRDDSTATLARIIEGPYPNYRQVIPREVPEVVGALPPLNAEYIGRFAHVDNSQYRAVTLTPTGNLRPVVVTFQNNPDAFGLIMPLVESADAPRTVPAWLHPAPAAVAEEPAASSPDGYGPQAIAPEEPAA